MKSKKSDCHKNGHHKGHGWMMVLCDDPDMDLLGRAFLLCSVCGDGVKVSKQ